MGSLWQWCRVHVLARWRSHLGTLLMFAAALAAVEAWRTRNVPEGPAPDFTAEVVVGLSELSPIHAQISQVVSLVQWRSLHPGKPIAVHIWADWCPYCKVEEPVVTRVAADWPVLTVGSRSGNAPQVKRVMTQRQLPWVTAVDPNGAVSATYGLTVLPAWIVIDSNGRISSVSTGYTTEWGMRARLLWAQ